MKKELKHRIDQLMDKAIAGDADAQLNLAKEFIRGRLVEKSLENAKYWAFKSINEGNVSAEILYNDLCTENIEKYSSKSILLNKVFNCIQYLPLLIFVELILGIAGLIFVSDVKPLGTISLYLFLLGIASLILIGWLGDKLESYFSEHAKEKSMLLIMLVTHLFLLFIVF